MLHMHPAENDESQGCVCCFKSSPDFAVLVGEGAENPTALICVKTFQNRGKKLFVLFRILLIQGNKCTLQSPCHLDEFLWVIGFFFFGLLTWYCLERMNKLYLEVSIGQHTVLWLSTGPLSLHKTFLLLIGRRETPTQPSYFFSHLFIAFFSPVNSTTTQLQLPLSRGDPVYVP